MRRDVYIEDRPRVGGLLDNGSTGDRQFGGPLRKRYRRDRVAENVLRPGNRPVRRTVNVERQDPKLLVGPGRQDQAVRKQPDGPQVPIDRSMLDLKFHDDFPAVRISVYLRRGQRSGLVKCSCPRTPLRRRDFFSMFGFNQELEACH